MKDKKTDKGPRGLTGSFATLPITQDNKREAKTNRSIPAETNVAEAKDWVDFNKK